MKDRPIFTPSPARIDAMKAKIKRENEAKLMAGAEHHGSYVNQPFTMRTVRCAIPFTVQIRSLETM